MDLAPTKLCTISLKNGSTKSILNILKIKPAKAFSFKLTRNSYIFYCRKIISEKGENYGTNLF